MSVTNKLAAKLAKRLATTLANSGSGGTPDPSVPAFVTQPTDQTSVEGGTVTFTSLASGYPSPTYQWQRFVGSWGAISGATNRIYTFSPTGTDVDVPLRCVATNSEGTATSNECTLTALHVPLANTVAPAVTGSATFDSPLACSTGEYTGTTPITYTYQWFADDVAIVGATSNTYTPVVGDIGAMIRCEVTATNAAGSITVSSNEVGPITSIPTESFTFDSTTTKFDSTTITWDAT